jgi:hypothetical protein
MIVWVRSVNSALISLERFPWKLSPKEAVLCYSCHGVSCQPLVFLRHTLGQDDGWRGQVLPGEEAIPSTLNIPSYRTNMFTITLNKTRNARFRATPAFEVDSTDLNTGIRYKLYFGIHIINWATVCICFMI